MKQVSLLAPRTQLIASIRSQYADLVAPGLLDDWIRDPQSAPGRLTSSPWPDRIEVESIAREESGEYTVSGRIIEVTSADLAGSGSPNRIPVELRIAKIGGRWLVVQYRADRSLPSGAVDGMGDILDSPAAAAAVVRDYYRAISERRYREAYRLWGSDGAASGKSFEDFRAGFSETAEVTVRLGAPGRLGAAAGSRYVDVPVRVMARLRDGTRQEFAGTYTLRRSVVDGATSEQRAWHIYSAKVRQVS